MLRSGIKTGKLPFFIICGIFMLNIEVFSVDICMSRMVDYDKRRRFTAFSSFGTSAYISIYGASTIEIQR